MSDLEAPIDPPFDASDAEQVGRRRRSAKRAADQADQDFRAVAATPQGRRVLGALLERCGVWRTGFAGEQTHLSAFAEGERNIGLELLDRFSRLAPEVLLLILTDRFPKKGPTP